MSRRKQTLTAFAIVLSVECLCLGLVANRSFARNGATPSLLKAAARACSREAKLAAAKKPDAAFPDASLGDGSPDFSSAKTNVEIGCRSGVSARTFLRTFITPKVSRYISNSVLIL